MLILQIIINILISIQYFLLEALTGVIVSITNVIRCIIFYNYKKKNKEPSKTFLILFIIIAVVSGILTWQNRFSIIPIIATIIFTYGLWQDNVKITKICTAITAGNWLVYDIVVRAYSGALEFLLEGISAIIAVIRYEKSFEKCD